MSQKRRIDKKSSRTAAYTCMSRVSSFLEKESFLKSDDNIAVEMLPRFIKYLIKSKILNLKGRISPKGIYQYVIARTKYFDHVFLHAVNNGVEQILIMGAGFDSRAIRLLGGNHITKVFEIDAPNTMKAKIKQYSKRKIITRINGTHCIVLAKKNNL